MQTQRLLVHGLVRQNGVYTPDKGDNAGKDFPYDNLKLYCSIEFSDTAKAAGRHEVILDWKKHGQDFETLSSLELPAYADVTTRTSYVKGVLTQVVESVNFLD